MLRKLTVFITVAVMLTAGAVMAADTYTIDKSHSSAGFSVRHLLISNVTGTFSEFSGTIMYDRNDITKSSVEVTIATASVDTDDEGRDKHLRSADFFNVEKYPQITFKSTRVIKTEGGFDLTGEFTLNGVTKEITFPVEFIGQAVGPMGKMRLGFEARTKIDRKDYGITWNKTFDAGGVAVGDEVKIELNIEAVAK